MPVFGINKSVFLCKRDKILEILGILIKLNN